jgi:hypothetical protein
MKNRLHGEEIDVMEEAFVSEGRDGLHDAALPFASPALMTPAVVVGRLIALVAGTGPLVDFPANNSGEGLAARSIVALKDAHIGTEVALAFEDGDPTRPMILGLVERWDSRAADITPDSLASAPGQMEQKRETLLLTADREITLRCGKSSITLTSAGKLLLRGAYLLSRSSGVNRIKGGSVQIN